MSSTSRHASTLRTVRSGRARSLRAVFMAGPLVAMSWVGAHAAFTDSVVVNTTLSTGSIDIKANGSDGPYTFVNLTTTNMIPGTTTYAPLVITNNGTVNFTYSMATVAGGDATLASALTIGIKTVPGPTCDATAYGSGTVVYAEAAGLGSAAIASRPLVATTGTETLCFKVSLPTGAANTLQGKTSTAAFTFSATT